MSLIELWMSLVGISMAAAGIPQAYRILKRKQSDDVSILLWVVIIHGLFWWLYYGVRISSPCLITTNLICIIIDVFVLVLVLKYRTHKDKAGGEHKLFWCPPLCPKCFTMHDPEGPCYLWKVDKDKDRIRTNYY